MDFIGQAIQYFQSHTAEILIRLVLAALIVVVGYFLSRLFARIASRAISRSGDRSGDHRRITLAPIVRTLVFMFCFIGACVMALDHLGFNVATILAGAGVLGLAVGFGAQTLVKDCLSGFFLILDDIVSQDDVVEIDGVTGTVEAVGLRVTKIRAYSGQLWFVPNGEISKVGNWNRSWVRAIVEVGLAYEQDVRKGIQILQSVGDQWAKEQQDLVLEPPEAQGVLGLNASDVGVRMVIKIDNSGGALWSAERELRKRIKAAFDEHGIEIPFPRHVVYHRKEDIENSVD